mmetsp:Transcript_44890/g.83775  ORF Transcript_44890/g.83775 Transcript_44890/m.83775 type:complete len:276 (+) Transcript_44890:55-882(+)
MGLRLQLILAACLLSRGYAFEVLYAGAPRTGTQTMYTALSILGLNPLHSGYNMSVRQPMCEYLYGEGPRAAAMDVFKMGFHAAMDEPFHLLFEDVLREFPDAKLILPATSWEEWYQSERNYFQSKFEWEDALEHTRFGRQLKIKRNGHGVYDISDAAFTKFLQSTPTLEHCWGCQYWGCHMWRREGMTAEENRSCISGFNSHVERVKALTPPSRLLIFNLSDGWGPLCEFLGKPIPQEPFPYTDKYNDEAGDGTAEGAASSFLQSALETTLRQEL